MSFDICVYVCMSLSSSACECICPQIYLTSLYRLETGQSLDIYKQGVCLKPSNAGAGDKALTGE